jgi:hypothetical protein
VALDPPSPSEPAAAGPPDDGVVAPGDGLGAGLGDGLAGGEVIPTAGLTATDPDEVWARRFAFAEQVMAIAVVVACAVYVLWQLRPELLLRNTTTNGGDMGAHVWWPAYVRDHLLPHWRVAGWAPDWYAGFPVGQFYFPLPSLLIIALNVVLPYNIAFKLVSAAGPVALPVAAYMFVRSLRLPRLAAPLCSLATVVLLFFKGDPRTHPDSKTAAFDQHIMGGTLASNLAGEFSFTIALALALFAFAALVYALERRRRLALPAALLAATVLSHLVVGIFAGVGALIIWLAYRPAVNVRITAAIAAVAVALTAFWSFPLAATFGYTTNMNYERISKYTLFMFPRYFWWVFGFAIVAVLMGAYSRRRGTMIVLALTVVFGLVFRFWPQSHAWNLRFLPFWYVCLFLLAGIGAAEIVVALSSFAMRFVFVDPHPQPTPAPVDQVDVPDGAGIPSETVVTESRAPSADVVRRRAVFANGVAIALVGALAIGTLVRVHQRRGFLPFWAEWNYSGYEQSSGRAGKASAEFRQLVHTMSALPPGRAMWEGGSAIDRYGTPLALELLPYFTHGRIASMEGLYFESSATTPYHFVAVSALSASGNASNPVRGLQYKTIGDFRLGVRYLRLLGVRYFMAYSKDAKSAADSDSGELRLVARVPDLDNQAPQGWSVYEVRNAPLVEGLRYEPVVATSITGGTTAQCYGTSDTPGTAPVHLDPWECLAAGWFDKAVNLDRPLASGGPPSWARARAQLADLAPERRALAAVAVSRLRSGDDRISFHVSRTGVPVVVKASYFPNWKASGAKGPWRLTPNLMVVIPTSHDVSLHYGRTGVEWLGIVVTLAGFAGLVALVRWRPMPAVEPDRPRRRRRRGGGVGDGLEPPHDGDGSRDNGETAQQPALA